MPDMMAIISKAVFEKESPGAKPSDVVPLAVYRSASKFLEKLDASSRLFLVTARPDDRLWLVAVLEGLQFDGKVWNANRNTRPLTDVTHVKGELKFESGKGIQAAKGQLGMSLQTPRVLTTNDVKVLLDAAGGAVAPAPKPASTGPRNLTAHEASSPLPCLCKACLPRASERATAGGMEFIRTSVEAKGRLLHFWVPAELAAQLSDVSQSVKSSLMSRLKAPPGAAASS